MTAGPNRSRQKARGTAGKGRTEERCALAIGNLLTMQERGRGRADNAATDHPARPWYLRIRRVYATRWTIVQNVGSSASCLPAGLRRDHRIVFREQRHEGLLARHPA